MKIRLMTKNTPLFDHSGLVLRPFWSEHDVDEIGEDGRMAIEKYNDHILVVHPHDDEALAAVKEMNATARGKTAPKSVAPAPRPVASKKEQG